MPGDASRPDFLENEGDVARPVSVFVHHSKGSLIITRDQSSLFCDKGQDACDMIVYSTLLHGQFWSSLV